MTALAADRATPNVVNLDAVQGGIVLDIGIMASQQIYRGGFVALDSTGYLQPAGTDAAGETFVGLAVENALGTSTAGAVTAKVLMGASVQHLVTGALVTTTGEPVYASDDQTLTLTAATNTLIGSISHWVSGTTCIVKLNTPAVATQSIVEAHTAGDTLLAAESHSIHTTVGAAGAVTFAMPAALAGMEFKFKVGAAQELRIDPNGTETCALPSTGVQGAAGKYLTANAAGETVYLVCDTAGTWSCYGFTGTWTAEA